MNARCTVMKIRLTEDEANNVRAYAKDCGLTPTALLRMLSQNLKPKPLPPESFWEDMNALYEIHGCLPEDSRRKLEKLILRLQSVLTQPERIKHGGNKDMGG